MGVIVLLTENNAQTDALLREMRRDGISDGRWIALTPFAMEDLEKRGMKFHIPEEFFSEEGLFSATTADSVQKVDELIRLVDEDIKKTIPWYRENNIDVLKYYKFPLTVAFDTVIYRTFALKELIEKLDPEEVWATESDVPFYSPGSFINQELNLWAECLKAMKVRSRIIKATAKGNKWIDPGLVKDRLYSFVTKYPFIYDLSRLLRGKIKPDAKGDKRLLLLGNEFDWAYTFGLFNSKGYGIEQIVSPSPAHFKLPQIDISFLASDRYSDVLRFRGVDLSAVLMPPLKKNISEAALKGAGYYLAGKMYIKNKDPQALLMSVMPDPSGWFIAKAFKDSGIPVVIWAHGGTGMAEYSRQVIDELIELDYYFCQGDGVAEKYMEYRNEYDFMPVPIGFSSLDILKTAGSKEKEIDILYATTNYMQNNYYTAFSPARTDNGFFLSQRIFLDYFGKCKKKVVFKTHPSPLYRNPPIMLSENIMHVGGGKSYTELLLKSGLVVIDIPTTTLIQAASTSIPIFVLTKFIKFTQRANALLEKRAVTSETPEGLVKKIDEYIKTGYYNADVNDRSFIKAHGTHLDDGESTLRAVEGVIDIIGKTGIAKHCAVRNAV